MSIRTITILLFYCKRRRFQSIVYQGYKGFETVIKDSICELQAKVGHKKEQKWEVVLVSEFLSRYIEQSELRDERDKLQKDGNRSELIDFEHNGSEQIVNCHDDPHHEVEGQHLIQVSFIHGVGFIKKEVGEGIQGRRRQGWEVEVVC